MNKIIRASAGTGKTYSLVEDICNAICEDNIDPREIIAMTFTEKAAAELRSRIQAKLAEKGFLEKAMLVNDALTGTIDSICNSLVQRFPLEAELAPGMRIVNGSEKQMVFNQALDSAYEEMFTDEHRETVHRLGQKEGLNTHARDIAEMAEVNCISADDLADMARDSQALFLDVIGCKGDVREKQSNFAVNTAQELDATISFLKNDPEAQMRLTGGDKKAIDVITDLINKLKNNSFIWADVQSAAGKASDFSKKNAETGEDLARLLNRHVTDPLFVNDMCVYIELVFAFAARAMKTFAELKLRYGVIDYSDMETHALKMLRRDDVRLALDRDFKLLFVDEFQDTSPLQLAIFMELWKITGNMIWVGDRKQCIYAFRGTDPELVENAYALFAGDGTTTTERTLDITYRTRPALMNILNRIFSAHFTKRGYNKDELELKCNRNDDQELTTPAWQFWLGQTKKKSSEMATVEGIKSLLKEKPMVYDRKTMAARQLKCSDIAVLSMSNNDNRELADLLRENGIECVLNNLNPFDSEEGMYLLSALALCLDSNSRFDMVMLNYLERGGRPDVFFHDLDKSTLAASEPVAEILRISNECRHYSPSQLLATLASGRLRELCLQWGDHQQRFVNLDAMARYAEEYENAAKAGISGATLAGLYRKLDELRTMNVPEAGRQPLAGNDHAVNICTMHGAKGLEWPVVILNGVLEGVSQKINGNFAGKVHTRQETFDQQDVLRGRSLRFVPWPYNAGTTNNCLLADKLLDHDFFAKVEDRLLAEKERLLYVAMTRARDALVITGKAGLLSAKPKKDEKQKYLEMVCGPLNLFNMTCGRKVVVNLGHAGRTECDIFSFDVTDPALDNQNDRPKYWFGGSLQSHAREPYRLSPSKIDFFNNIEHPAILFEEGERFEMAGSVQDHDDCDDDSVFGTVIHEFFAADHGSISESELEERARNLIVLRGMKGLILEKGLAASYQRMNCFLDRYFKGWKVFREMPVRYRMPTNLVCGIADMVLSDGESFVVIDYKTFRGSHAQCQKRASNYFSQLAAYGHGLELATGEKCGGLVLYFATSNCFVELGKSGRF